jgi:hypothetical protein
VDVHASRGPHGLGDKYVRLYKANPNASEGMGIQPLFSLLTDRSGPNETLISLCLFG